MQQLYFRSKPQCYTTYAPAPDFAPRLFQIRTIAPTGSAHQDAHWWQPIYTNYGPCCSRRIRGLGPHRFWPECIAPPHLLETPPDDRLQALLQILASHPGHADTHRQACSQKLTQPGLNRVQYLAHMLGGRRPITGRSPLKFGLNVAWHSLKSFIISDLNLSPSKVPGNFVNPILT